jgi:proline racemase
LKIDEEFIHESIIGTTFKCRIVDTARVGEFEAVITEITGKAYITGTHTFHIDPEDPLGEGFKIG